MASIGEAFERLYDDSNDPWGDHPDEAARLDREWAALVPRED